MFNEIISDTTTISLELMSGWSSVENGFFFDQDLPMIVSTLRVQLNRSKKEVNKKDLAFLSNREFPIALKPKNKHTKGVKMFYTRDTRQQHNTIKRPRNKFILARTILSKVVKAQSTELTNDDTSRIISWVSFNGWIFHYKKTNNLYRFGRIVLVSFRDISIIYRLLKNSGTAFTILNIPSHQRQKQMVLLIKS